MSKLSFRARALDASKPMPIYLSEELPDLPEYLSINRAVPQMPSGMEKEEESERHLQEAISAGKVIPTPEIFSLEDLGELDRLDRLYPTNHKVPKQYIHYQSYAFDNDAPEYDLDSEDEKWVNAQVKKMDVPLTYDQFEEMMDRLEKGSGQQVITLKEAKLLLKEDDELIVAVYDYWLNKRLRLQYPLIPAVKTEKTVGLSHTNNPYIAFRRRVEKMQTRKNRKNDEASYEKMLKLRRDLSRAVTILEMIKRREKMKKEHLHLTVEIFEKRYAIGDYSGQVLTDVSSQKASAAAAAAASAAASAPSPAAAPAGCSGVTSRPAYSPLYLNQHQWATKVKIRPSQDDHSQKEKRSYKKRKHSRPHLSAARPSTSGGFVPPHPGDVVIDTVTSDEDEHSPAPPPPPPPAASLPPPPPPAAFSEEEDPEPDGEFTFRRKRNCSYLAPSLSSRLEAAPAPQPSAAAARRQRFHLGSLSRPKRHCLGMVRHRLGRGGRVVIDRAHTDDDDYWRSLDFTVLTGAGSTPSDTPHFHPVPSSSPPSSPERDVENYIQSLPSGYHIEGTAAEGAAPPGRPLTVHMVPSSSVRLVATPEEAAAAHSPPAQPPSPHGWPASSAFAVAPADTFSELVTNLISPYLVDSDGVLLTSAESTPEWGAAGDSEVGAADGSASQPPPAGGAGSRPADSAQLERASRPGAAAGGGAAPSGLVTLLGGPGAGSHVLLADTPPSLELIPEKANNAGTVSETPSQDAKPPSSAGHLVKKLVRKGSGAMEVT